MISQRCRVCFLALRESPPRPPFRLRRLYRPSSPTLLELTVRPHKPSPPLIPAFNHAKTLFFFIVSFQSSARLASPLTPTHVRPFIRLPSHHLARSTLGSSLLPLKRYGNYPPDKAPSAETGRRETSETSSTRTHDDEDSDSGSDSDSDSDSDGDVPAAAYREREALARAVDGGDDRACPAIPLAVLELKYSIKTISNQGSEALKITVEVRYIGRVASCCVTPKYRSTPEFGMPSPRNDQVVVNFTPFCCT